jgi:hypothetical protein
MAAAAVGSLGVCEAREKEFRQILGDVRENLAVSPKAARKRDGEKSQPYERFHGFTQGTFYLNLKPPQQSRDERVLLWPYEYLGISGDRSRAEDFRFG